MFFSSGVSSQVITLVDIKTAEPIEQATFDAGEKKLFAITNVKGQVDIGIFKGRDYIEVRAVGYKTLFVSYEELAKKAEFLMSPTITSIAPVIIKGTRLSQLSHEIPNKVITITNKDIAFQNPQTAADVLGSSGKVFIQKSQQGGGSPMIRGFATNRLLYTVDGIRMNTAIFRGGNIQNVISLDPFTLESAEVLFGPGSVLYGSDAIGGVMSFKTITPSFSLTNKTSVLGKVLTRYSSANNEITGHFDINVGWDKWAMVTSFSNFYYNDLKMGNNGPNDYLRPFYVQRIDNEDVVVTNKDHNLQAPTGYSQTNLMQKLRCLATDEWDFRYGFHYSETSNFDRYDRHIQLKDGNPRYGEWYYGPQKWLMNNITATNSVTNFFYEQMVVRMAHQQFQESRISRDFNDSIREIRKEKVDAYSVNADFVKHLTKKIKAFYGVEYIFNKVSSSGINEDIVNNTQINGPSRYPNSNWESVGAYLSNQFNISKVLHLHGSVRYNYFDLNANFDTTFYPFPFTKAKVENSSVTGSIGTVLRPDSNWMISANIATAFRSPNVDDIGKVFDSEPGSVTVPNPFLSAEYAYNADLNLAKSFGKNAKIEVSGFYTLLRDALFRGSYTFNGIDSIYYDGLLSGVQAIQNSARAEVYGVQAGVTIKLNKQFSFSSDISYQVGTEELEDGTISPSRHAAPLFGVSRLSFNAKSLTLQIYANYSGQKLFEDLPETEQNKAYLYATDDQGNPYSPSWATLNLKALFRLNDLISFSGGVENITDIRYRPYSSGIAAAGRNFILSARCNF